MSPDIKISLKMERKLMQEAFKFVYDMFFFKTHAKAAGKRFVSKEVM